MKKYGCDLLPMKETILMICYKNSHNKSFYILLLCCEAIRQITLFIHSTSSRLLLTGSVPHGIIAADIRSRNRVNQSTVNRAYQITGGRIHRIISPILGRRCIITALSVAGSISTARLIVSGLSITGSVTVILIFTVLGLLGILIGDLDLFFCQLLDLLLRQLLRHEDIQIRQHFRQNIFVAILVANFLHHPAVMHWHDLRPDSDLGIIRRYIP